MSAPGTILVVDDEKNIRLTLSMVLEADGFDVVTAPTAEEGLDAIARKPVDAVMLDVSLPGMDGIAALRILLERERDLPVVMISGHATIQDAVEATRLGAFDFLEKPLSRERVLGTMRNCVEARRQARARKAAPRPAPAEAPRGVFGLLGRTPVMVDLRAQIGKVAPTRARVLITGESGTGKELVARAIHEASDRAGKPFVKVNCAAIPHDLIESTLFGHEKGAFTSAAARRRGQFELAHTGTLFLDEIGDMSLSAQAKVLRVLQTGELTRVGGEQPIDVDVRVVAATNKNLEEACREGSFREDLYFRLNVLPLLTPPLRSRRGDIPELVDHFLAEVCRENGLSTKRVTEEVLKRLAAYDWPGNVRELRNVVERMAILAGEEIVPGDLPPDFERRTLAASDDLGDIFQSGSLKSFRDAAEKAFLEARLRENDWNISKTADAIGLERTNLHKKMKALGIQRDK